MQNHTHNILIKSKERKAFSEQLYCFHKLSMLNVILCAVQNSNSPMWETHQWQQDYHVQSYMHEHIHCANVYSQYGYILKYGNVHSTLFSHKYINNISISGQDNIASSL